MIDIKYVTANPDVVTANCAARNMPADIPGLIELYRASNAEFAKIGALRAEANVNAKSMQGKISPEERQTLILRGKDLKAVLQALEARIQPLRRQREAQLALLPNLTHSSTPTDKDRLLRYWHRPVLNFDPKGHESLAEIHDLIDFDAGAKVAGTKFYFLKNELVFLDLALQRFVLDKLVAKGFTPMMTPDLARPEILEGIGFNPRGDTSQVYNIEGHDLCLIGTAEIPLGGMFKDTLLKSDEVPIKIAGISHCFRTEAGSAGKEGAGLYRVHQFTKVEMFVICQGDILVSDSIHGEIVAIEEEIFRDLGVPHRVMDIAAPDLGAPAYRKIDLEAWMPGRRIFGEVTSASNCTDYQARRLNIRAYPPPIEGGRPRYVHTLNGTAIATGRAMIAILENHQQEDGSILMPQALLPYLPFDRIAGKVS